MAFIPENGWWLWPPSWGECHEHSIALLDQVRQPHRLHPGGTDHYLQFVEACRGNGKTSAPSTTPVRSPSRSLLAAWRPDFPGQPSSGTPPT